MLFALAAGAFVTAFFFTAGPLEQVKVSLAAAVGNKQLVGFAVEALRRDRKVKETLKIPADETIYAVIALGYPAITFLRPASRRKVPVRWM